MQVIGIAPAFAAIGVIAARTASQTVSDWADRVVRRHIRRTPELHQRLTTEKAVLAAAALDRLPPEVVAKIVAAFKDGEDIHAPQKDRLQDFIHRALDTMDFIESLPPSDRRIRRIERLSWADAEKMSEDWHASLTKLRSKSKDAQDGVCKIAELSDGSFFAELTTAQALRNEGAEMGHCVGGYWNRVKSGDTKIVSLRDGDGHPHVTIELSRPSEVQVEGHGKLRLMSHLRPGLNQVVASVDWYAAQIRGKQNRIPVPRYAEKVRQWMIDNSIPSREEGFAVCADDETLSIYAVRRAKDYFLTDSPAAAFTVAAEIALAQLAAGDTMPESLVRVMHLDEIIRDVTDDVAVATFARSAFSSFMRYMEAFHKRDEGNVLRKLLQSGFERFVKACFKGRNIGFDPLAEAATFLCSIDERSEVTVHGHCLAAVPGGQTLAARIHTLPALGLALIGSGRATGIEERILNELEPKLRKIVEAVKSEQDAYHVIRPSAPGVCKNDIVQAFFACGLGRQYASAAAMTQPAVRLHIKDMLLEAKRARIAGKNANIVFNLLSEGYETRLTGLLRDTFGQECLVVGPEPSKPAITARAISAPVVKSYPMPRGR
jgi:hypothetical protein